jgi:hypothetical protein
VTPQSSKRLCSYVESGPPPTEPNLVVGALPAALPLGEHPVEEKGKENKKKMTKKGKKIRKAKK